MVPPETPAQVDPDQIRAILVDFYDRVFDDIMIGFMFKGKDKARLIEKEWELTLSALGEKVRYTGRSMHSAHLSLRIFRGHFDRRLQILRETMRDHGLDPELARKWLEHAESLRAMLVRRSEDGEFENP